jgi:N utilization substance protein A
VVEDGLAGVLVEKGDMGLAIGKGGANVARASKVLSMEVWFVENSDDERTFIQNMFEPAKPKNISFAGGVDGKKAVVSVSKYEKGMAVGREGRKIRLARKLAKRHHDIKDIRIIVR